MYDFELARLTAEQNAKQRRPELVDKMRANGVTAVYVAFDGSGDDGAIDEVDVTPAGIKLPDDFEDWVYDFLEGTGVNWQINEGGYGTIEFDLVGNTFSYYVFSRAMFETLEASGDEEL